MYKITRGQTNRALYTYKVKDEKKQQTRNKATV